jgi:bifunctional DNA-binding transcriptional regulator/antitoxin component of YhaV-PrlF toxin-antitoxin module
VKKYVAVVKHIDTTDDLYLILPDDLLEVMKWKEGTIVKWTDNKDGSWHLKKCDDFEGEYHDWTA